MNLSCGNCTNFPVLDQKNDCVRTAHENLWTSIGNFPRSSDCPKVP
jgi:hypothetical protein